MDNLHPIFRQLLAPYTPPAKIPSPRFANVSCSQCGASFGPGEHGYSHCEDHHRALDEAMSRSKILDSYGQRQYRSALALQIQHDPENWRAA